MRSELQPFPEYLNLTPKHLKLRLSDQIQDFINQYHWGGGQNFRPALRVRPQSQHQICHVSRLEILFLRSSVGHPGYAHGTVAGGFGGSDQSIELRSGIRGAGAQIHL